MNMIREETLTLLGFLQVTTMNVEEDFVRSRSRFSGFTLLMSTRLVYLGTVDHLKPFLALYRQIVVCCLQRGLQAWRNIHPFNTSCYDVHALTYLGFSQVTPLDFGGEFYPVLLASL